ncbi:MAG: putative lipid II flippase FtsW, partial [Spirochaetes bacterium]|nr:putative lipid II flippase FtsW [Spirochaetota bacterium]
MERVEKERGDFFLMLLVIVMTGTGLALLFSASSSFSSRTWQDPLYLVRRQLIWVGLGAAAAFVLSLTPLPFLRARMPVLLLASLVLMLLPFVPGLSVERLGARRWFGIFGQTFQPAEAAKAVLVLYLASYFGHRGDEPLMADLVPPLVVTLVFAALVYAQNDYSTAVFVAVVGLGMCFAAGARALTLVALGLFALPLGFLLLFTREHRVARLLTFLGISADPAGSAWQIVNSHAALVAGGFWGTGLGRGTARLGALPEAHSDFIFSVIGEETGFAGVLFVLALFAVFAWRGFSLAAKADDRFASLAAYGITLTIILQAMLNMAVAVGLVPTTGVTLPFFSAGGSSMLATLALCGVLVNVSRCAH